VNLWQALREAMAPSRTTTTTLMETTWSATHEMVDHRDRNKFWIAHWLRRRELILLLHGSHDLSYNETRQRRRELNFDVVWISIRIDTGHVCMLGTYAR
jgi:hypothetical protein